MSAGHRDCKSGKDCQYKNARIDALAAAQYADFIGRLQARITVT